MTTPWRTTNWWRCRLLKAYGDRTEVRAWSAIMPVTPAWLHEYPSVCLCLCRVVQTTYSLASITYTTNKPCAYKVNKSRRLMDKAHFAELVYNLNLITESSSWRKYSYENEAIHAYRLSRRSAVQLDLLLWRNDYSAHDRGAEYCDERVCLCVYVCLCVRVCLSAIISSEPYVRSSPTFLCTLPVSDFFKSVNIWQSYKQERGCLVHCNFAKYSSISIF